MQRGCAEKLRMHCAIFSWTSRFPFRIMWIIMSMYTLSCSMCAMLTSLQVILYSTLDRFSVTSSLSTTETSRMARTTGLRCSKGEKRTLTYFSTLEQFSRILSGTPCTQITLSMRTMFTSSSSLSTFAAKATTARSMRETSFQMSVEFTPRICASIFAISCCCSSSCTHTLELDNCTKICSSALFMAASLLRARASSRRRWTLLSTSSLRHCGTHAML